MNLIEQILAARRVGTPLLFLSTPDPVALMRSALAAINGGAPAVQWDRAEGFRALNEPGADALSKVASPDELALTSPDPLTAMRMASRFPKRTVTFAYNLSRFFKEGGAEGAVIQAVSNLRDPYKADGRTLVMLAPEVSLPTELRQDVVTFDDPLPEDTGYSEIVEAISGKVNAETMRSAVAAVRGLSSFRAEQILAMSMDLKTRTLNLDRVWEHKVETVKQVPGLSMTLTGPKLTDLRGLDSVVETMADLFSGPDRPNLVLRVDEADKGFAGLGANGGPGDNTGVSQDVHNQFLTQMEDNGWTGAILWGVRGAGKTVLSQAIGAAYGVPTIAMDLGAMRHGIVGESEQNIRDAFRMVRSIGKDKVIVLMTCNDMSVMKPELLRRFKLQTWYFDLLTAVEREALWPVYLKKNALPLDSVLPDDEGWTGAEIRNCCELARALGKSVSVIGPRFIIPVSRTDAKGLATMREQADGHRLSVAYPGPYRINKPVVAPKGRRMES